MNPERLSSNDIINNMSLKNKFVRDQLVQPIFIHEDEKSESSIPGLGKNRILFKSNVIESISRDLKNGCRNFILFLFQKIKAIPDLMRNFKKTFC